MTDHDSIRSAAERYRDARTAEIQATRPGASFELSNVATGRMKGWIRMVLQDPDGWSPYVFIGASSGLVYQAVRKGSFWVNGPGCGSVFTILDRTTEAKAS